MPIITEQQIESTSARLEGNRAYEAAVREWQEKQPVVAGWLFSENFELFTRPEREYLLYLVLVIFFSIESATGEVPAPDEEEISQAEEANWQKLSADGGKGFHEKLNIFFEESRQEDLLAFAEDALSDVEDDLVTKEGREALFVVLKTLIDCWTDRDLTSD